MVQKLYALVDRKTGKIMRKTGNKPRIGVFSSEGNARQHAWRYGAKEDNFEIVTYVPMCLDGKDD